MFPWFPSSELKTALVERDDFSSGTSSRSTKLIHGGVRYLQKAIMKLDYEQVNASFFLHSWHLSAEFLVPLVILLYLPPYVHFSFTRSPDMFALNDCLPGIFWSCFKEFFTTWQSTTPAVIKLWINRWDYFKVMGGIRPMCPPLSVNCLRRVTQVQTEMSPFSVTFHSIWGISLFSACVFFGSLILLSVWIC